LLDYIVVTVHYKNFVTIPAYLENDLCINEYI